MAQYLKKTDRDKPWARKPVGRDVTVTRQVRNIFLIYCEGKNTEPEYFRAFPVNSETKIEAVGTGRSRTALVKYIIKLASAAAMLRGQKNYDPDRQIWAVFDHDDRNLGESEEFDAAIELANTNELRVAYSSDAFELWFFLHDQYTDGQLHRDHYFEYLSEVFGINYREDGKSLEFSKSLYGAYLSRQPRAIRHAEKLVRSYKVETRPSHQNPCTTVHYLVQELNKCLKT